MRYARLMVAIATATALTIGAHDAALSQQNRSEAAAKDQKKSFQVGDVLPAGAVHIITNPGRYGLGPEPDNSRYALAHGKLIRIDPKTYQVKSILRTQEKQLD